MDWFLPGLLIALLAGVIGAALYEYRLRQPDLLVLAEKDGQVRLRSGAFYPRHFSLALKRNPHAIQLEVEAAASGNLGVQIKLVGSVAPALAHLPALVRVGGWRSEATARAAQEASLLLESWVKEYTEQAEIRHLSSTGLAAAITARAELLPEKYGLELISLAVQTLAATDTAIAEALRQQEQARILEQTEQLHQQARVAAARAKFQADEEIAALEHTLELKKAALKKDLLAQEAVLAQQRVADELARSRMRLALEKEELEIIKNNPELLVLSPQAARLAEASQGLKNARTVISVGAAGGTGDDLLALLQTFLQQALGQAARQTTGTQAKGAEYTGAGHSASEG